MLAPWLTSHWQGWCRRLDAGKFPHAVLVAGPSGLGKRDLVAALSARLLCTQPGADGLACNRCRGCQLRAAGTHPDRVVLTLEARDDGKLRSEIVIDQIRELGGRLATKPAFGGWQVALIDPADRMNHAAANALLKTLEEPSDNTVMILVAETPERLPATIRSRCQRLDLRPPELDLARAWLQAQGATPALCEEALAFADGNPGAAKALIDARFDQVLDRLIEDLGNAARGRSLLEIATRWEALDGELALALLARLVLFAMPVAIERRPFARVEALSRLTASVDFRKLQAWWDRLNLARVRLSSPLRKDLAMVELLDEWRTVVSAGGI